MGKLMEKFLQALLKLTNVILSIFGALMLFYWVWMFFFSLWNYRKYLFSSWFIWGCFTVGTIFCLTASAGLMAASTKSHLLLLYHIIVMMTLLLVEILLTTDVLLNQNWEKTFPKDKTYRFEDFVDFVEANPTIFFSLYCSLLITQVISLTIALVLRSRISRSLPSYIKNYDDHHHQQVVPFLNHHHHHIEAPPYVVGHPHHHSSENNNVVDNNIITSWNGDFVQYADKTIWGFCNSFHGYYM